MLSISHFRHRRLAAAMSRQSISIITTIPQPRIKELELGKAEPWFDEALRIARCLGVSVSDLISPATMDVFDADPRYYPVDLKFWGEGSRITLPMAIRLSRRFNLSRVEDLEASPLIHQIWSTLSQSERLHDSAGTCPWCLASIATGNPHLPTCLPHNVIGARSSSIFTTTMTADSPRPTRKGRRSGSAPAKGLKAIRLAQRKSQQEMADMLGFNVNHYARVERCELPLTLGKSERLVEMLGIDRHLLYVNPETVE